MRGFSYGFWLKKALKSVFLLFMAIVIASGINRGWYVALRDSADSERKIIEAFNDNYDLFAETVAYLQSEPGDLYYVNSYFRVTVHSGFKETDMAGCPAEEQISYIMNRLGFEAINEDNDGDKVTFWRFLDNLEKGVVYSKTALEEYDRFYGKIALIRDNWYYIKLENHT